MSKIYTVAVLFLSSKHEEEAGIVAGHIKRNKVIAVSSIEKIDTSLDIDIAVIVGGDGSFVRAANKFVGKNTKFFCLYHYIAIYLVYLLPFDFSLLTLLHLRHVLLTTC